jgi:hypothetical protein
MSSYGAFSHQLQDKVHTQVKKLCKTISLKTFEVQMAKYDLQHQYHFQIIIIIPIIMFLNWATGH